MGALFILLLVAGIVYIYFEVDPKIDFNTETGDYLLWYNDPSDQKIRKSIPLWKAKIEEKSD